MPCISDYGPDDPFKTVQEYNKRMDERTDMLCRAMTLLEAAFGSTLNLRLEKDILDWWKYHKEFDRKRKR